MENEQEQFVVDEAEIVASSAVTLQDEQESLPLDQDENFDVENFEHEDFESLQNDSNSSNPNDDVEEKEDLGNDNQQKGPKSRILSFRPRSILSRHQQNQLPTDSINHISELARVVNTLARTFDTEAGKAAVPTNAAKIVKTVKKPLVQKPPVKRSNQDELEPEDAAQQKKRSRKEITKKQRSSKVQKRGRARSRSHSKANKSAAKKQKK